MRLDRRPVAERRVWPPVVVISHPRGNPRPRIGKPAEQAFVQELVAHAAVERLHEAVLHRLARRDEVPGDTGRLAPGQLAELMVEFDPRFEIMPGTKARTDLAEVEPFAGDVGALIPE